jgi:hypothetical protein
MSSRSTSRAPAAPLLLAAMLLMLLASPSPAASAASSARGLLEGANAAANAAARKAGSGKGGASCPDAQACNLATFDELDSTYDSLLEFQQPFTAETIAVVTDPADQNGCVASVLPGSPDVSKFCSLMPNAAVPSLTILTFCPNNFRLVPETVCEGALVTDEGEIMSYLPVLATGSDGQAAQCTISIASVSPIPAGLSVAAVGGVTCTYNIDALPGGAAAKKEAGAGRVGPSTAAAVGLAAAAAAKPAKAAPAAKAAKFAAAIKAAKAAAAAGNNNTKKGGGVAAPNKPAAVAAPAVRSTPVAANTAAAAKKAGSGKGGASCPDAEACNLATFDELDSAYGSFLGFLAPLRAETIAVVTDPADQNGCVASVLSGSADVDVGCGLEPNDAVPSVGLTTFCPNSFRLVPEMVCQGTLQTDEGEIVSYLPILSATSEFGFSDCIVSLASVSPIPAGLSIVVVGGVTCTQNFDALPGGAAAKTEGGAGRVGPATAAAIAEAAAAAKPAKAAAAAKAAKAAAAIKAAKAAAAAGSNNTKKDGVVTAANKPAAVAAPAVRSTPVAANTAAAAAAKKAGSGKGGASCPDAEACNLATFDELDSAFASLLRFQSPFTAETIAVVTDPADQNGCVASPLFGAVATTCSLMPDAAVPSLTILTFCPNSFRLVPGTWCEGALVTDENEIVSNLPVLATSSDGQTAQCTISIASVSPIPAGLSVVAVGGVTCTQNEDVLAGAKKEAGAGRVGPSTAAAVAEAAAAAAAEPAKAAPAAKAAKLAAAIRAAKAAAAAGNNTKKGGGVAAAANKPAAVAAPAVRSAPVAANKAVVTP